MTWLASFHIISQLLFSFVSVFYEIVIKDANYKYKASYAFNLSQIGITETKQMNKSNEDFRMISAELNLSWKS